MHAPFSFLKNFRMFHSYFSSTGVNKRNFEELKAVCSEPIDHHYMGVEKYHELNDITDAIVAGACDVCEYCEIITIL